MSVKKQLKKIIIDEAVKIEVGSRQQYIQDVAKSYQSIAMDLNAAYLEFLNEFLTNTDDKE